MSLCLNETVLLFSNPFIPNIKLGLFYLFILLNVIVTGYLSELRTLKVTKREYYYLTMTRILLFNYDLFLIFVDYGRVNIFK